MMRIPCPGHSTYHLQAIMHDPPATQVHGSWDRVTIVARRILQLAEAPNWKLCAQLRLSERPSCIFSTVTNLALSFLTLMMGWMTVKIGKTIWTRWALPGITLGCQILTLSRWFKIMIVRLMPALITQSSKSHSFFTFHVLWEEFTESQRDFYHPLGHNSDLCTVEYSNRSSIGF